MAVQAFSLLGILEAQTSQFEARFAAAGTAIDRLTREQTVATRAVGQLRVGLQGLAQQALGVSGPFGQLTSSVIGLFGGPAGLAAVAAAGAIALAIRQIGRAAEAEAARIKKLDDAIKGLLQERGPNVALGERRQQVLEDLATRERDLEAARAAHGRVDRFGEITDNSQAINDLTAEIARLNTLLTLVSEKFTDARNQIIQSASERTIGGLSGALDLSGVPRGGPTGGWRGQRFGRFDILSPEEMLAHLAGSPEEQLKRRQEQEEENIKRLSAAASRLNNEWEQMDRAMETTALRAQILQVALINAVSGGLALAVSGGSIGGIFGAAGGIIGLGVKGLFTGNPIAGAVVSGVGAIISAAQSRSERHRERQTERLVDAMTEQRPLIIRVHDLSDSGLEAQNTRYNHYIGRGGRGPVPMLPRSTGLTRP